MAKHTQDKRRRTEAQKAQTRANWISAASRRRRVSEWTRAATGAARAGAPLNVALHITWDALLQGDRRDGHILGLAPAERDKRLWAALRLCAARAGVDWVAARGPEHDRRRGLHLHVVLHLPDARAIRDCMGVVEKLTGAPAEWADMRGRSMRGLGRRHHGVVARSACGGWFLQRHIAAAGGDGLGIAAYAAKGDGKAAVEGQHRLSNALKALAQQAAA
jgi:hypothetical protein